MKKISIISVFWIASLVYATASDSIPASDPLIEYTGRIDFSNAEAPRFSYSGVSIRASFNGTSIAAIFDDNIGQNYYNIFVDGRLVDTLLVTTGKKAYHLASGLENANHEVEIFKRTEEMFGKTQFYGFIVDEGATLTSLINNRDRYIEYIGNSITCGYGNEGLNGGIFGPTTENHYMTYAAITSRNFNARHLAVCKSGIGIYRNYDGPYTGNSDCMTNYYTRIFLYDENPKYSFTEQPDLVCINLGTNDFSTSGGDSSFYTSNFFRLIDTIQSKYTMPDIVCLLGSMISEPLLSDIRNYLGFIADSAHRKGKGNVYFFEMSQQTGDLGIGIDYHPTVAQHIRNGMELSGYIRSIKGWKITPLVLRSALIETRHIQLEFNTEVMDALNNFSGFRVYRNDQESVIDTIQKDTISDNLIHIWLDQSLEIGDRLNLSYTPGTVQSFDSVMLGTINYMTVQNTLSVTTATRGTVSTDGSKVTLTCNKNLKKNASIEGLTLRYADQEILETDSFSILNKQITLYLTNTVLEEDTVFANYTGLGIYGIDDIPLSPFEDLLLINNSVVTGISVNRLQPVLIYPNPNHAGIFFYRFQTTAPPGQGRLEITSTDGRLIHWEAISDTEGCVDIRDKMPEGIYIIKISWGDLNMSSLFLIRPE
jgi:hypothetical protein